MAGIQAEAAGFWTLNCSIAPAEDEVICSLPELNPYRSAFEVQVSVSASVSPVLQPSCR